MDGTLKAEQQTLVPLIRTQPLASTGRKGKGKKGEESSGVDRREREEKQLERDGRKGRKGLGKTEKKRRVDER